MIDRGGMLFVLIALGGSPVFAAQQYVRPGANGAGTGSDWANAYAELPPQLTRGDIYYLADGIYGHYTFDDAPDGTSLITVKKATESDHGTAAGWQSGYGDGQAIFSWWGVSQDYYLFDGQSRNVDWHLGQIDEYGIRVKGDGNALRLDDAGSAFADHVTFRRIDFEAGGRDTGRGDDVVYSNAWTGSGIGPQQVTFTECAMHDSDRTIFLMRQWAHLLVEYSYLARNASSPATHGEILSDDGSDDITFRYNVIEDPEGTAVFAILNGSGTKTPRNTADNWQIYGNVILHSASYDREGISGVSFVANDASNRNWADNWRVYNNTIYNIQGLWSGIVIQAGTANVVQNNLWYGCVTTNNGGGASYDYNWYYETGANGDQGTQTVTCSANCEIFVDAASRDFRLTTATHSGIELPSPHDRDRSGASRGGDGVWDRGAFEFGVMPAVPEAPGNLLVR